MPIEFYMQVIVSLMLGGSIALYQYYAIARTLPSVSDLRERASQFETTRILDRNGNVLYEIIDPNAGRRTYVPLDKVSPYVVAATIATEDKDFYSHPGFDPWAIIRIIAHSGGWVSCTTICVVSTRRSRCCRTASAITRPARTCAWPWPTA